MDFFKFSQDKVLNRFVKKFLPDYALRNKQYQIQFQKKRNNLIKKNNEGKTNKFIIQEKNNDNEADLDYFFLINPKLIITPVFF